MSARLSTNQLNSGRLQVIGHSYNTLSSFTGLERHGQNSFLHVAHAWFLTEIHINFHLWRGRGRGQWVRRTHVPTHTRARAHTLLCSCVRVCGYVHGYVRAWGGANTHVHCTSGIACTRNVGLDSYYRNRLNESCWLMQFCDRMHVIERCPGKGQRRIVILAPLSAPQMVCRLWTVCTISL